MKKILAYFTVFLAAVLSASAGYSVYQDMDDDGTPETYMGDVVPFDEGVDAVTAYNYYSWSSHMADPHPEAYKSKLWLYEDDNGLNLGMFHNVDNGGSFHWTHVRFMFYFHGTSGHVVFSDDTHELKKFGSVKFIGNWHYKRNTDGGIIGFDDDDEWTIRVSPYIWGDVQSWTFNSADEEDISLDMEHDVYILKTAGNGNDVPEFGTVGAVLALVGAGFVIRKKRN